jgi:hypothetical protein
MADQWQNTDDHTPARGAASGGWLSTDDHAPSAQQPESIGGQLKDIPRGFFNNLAQSGQGLMNLVAHPIDSLSNIGQAQDALRLKALDAFKKGRPIEGIAHSLYYLMPLIGPQLDAEGEKFAQGHWGEATGETLSTGLQLFAPEMVKGASVPVVPRLANPNPTEAAALDYLQSKGVNVPAGARTGSGFVKNIQKGVDSTPLGALVTRAEEARNTAALRAASDDLVGNATPPTPANALYGKFRDAELDPANIKTVQTSTRQVNTGMLDAKGNPITKTVPVTEDIPLPADVTSIKAQIKPIYDEMTQWWDPAKRNASAGYQAMQSILNGPDVVPASQAEAGLSGLKTLAREGTGRSAGVAKFIVPKLQQIVDDAAAQGGPDVVSALQEGRKAAARQFATDTLTKIFDKGKAEGGFNRQAGIWQDYQRARGDLAKQLPASQVADLDKFFLGAKKLAENPNPSGTATTLISMHSGGLIFTHPATGVPVTLGAGALSALLHSPAGVRALTQGIRLPLSAPGAALAAGQILKLAGQKPTAFPVAAQNDQTPQTDTPTGQLAQR